MVKCILYLHFSLLFILWEYPLTALPALLTPVPTSLLFCRYHCWLYSSHAVCLRHCHPMYGKKVVIIPLMILANATAVQICVHVGLY